MKPNKKITALDRKIENLIDKINAMERKGSDRTPYIPITTPRLLKRTETLFESDDYAIWTPTEFMERLHILAEEQGCDLDDLRISAAASCDSDRYPRIEIERSFTFTEDAASLANHNRVMEQQLNRNREMAHYRAIDDLKRELAPLQEQRKLLSEFFD